MNHLILQKNLKQKCLRAGKNLSQEPKNEPRAKKLSQEPKNLFQN
jgi:hypothetical protein